MVQFGKRDSKKRHSISKSEHHAIQFVNAFDILKEQKRNLFGIPEIDNLLNFSDKEFMHY